MADIENLSMEELFNLLESNNKSVVEEIQRLIHEKFSGTVLTNWIKIRSCMDKALGNILWLIDVEISWDVLLPVDFTPFQRRTALG